MGAAVIPRGFNGSSAGVLVPTKERKNKNHLEEAVEPISYWNGWKEQKSLPKAALGSSKVWPKISLIV